MQTETNPQSFVEAIRVAIEPTATAGQKHTGAAACRAILAALEAKPGAPLIQHAASPLAHLTKLPPEQLIELIVSKLRPARLAEEGATAAPATLSSGG